MGTREGLFRVVYRFENEQLLELINRTAHAAALSALVETENSYCFYFGVYARRVGRFTPIYMTLIDPFRKLVVYPSLLRTVSEKWNQTFGTTRTDMSEWSASACLVASANHDIPDIKPRLTTTYWDLLKQPDKQKSANTQLAKLPVAWAVAPEQRCRSGRFGNNQSRTGILDNVFMTGRNFKRSRETFLLHL